MSSFCFIYIIDIIKNISPNIIFNNIFLKTSLNTIRKVRGQKELDSLDF